MKRGPSLTRVGGRFAPFDFTDHVRKGTTVDEHESEKILEDDVRVLQEWLENDVDTPALRPAVRNVIKEIERRERHLKMQAAAEKYFRALEFWQLDTTDEETREALDAAESVLNEASTEFSDDAAFMTFLKLQRERAANPPIEIRALRAIRARLNGVWDDPDLMEVGPLFINPVEDIKRILDHLKGKKNRG